jgi:hypothetical protein
MIGASILAWMPMVLIAIASGLFREQVLARHLSELRAHQASCATGMLLFGLYGWLTVSIWRPGSSEETRPGLPRSYGAMATASRRARS